MAEIIARPGAEKSAIPEEYIEKFAPLVKRALEQMVPQEIRNQWPKGSVDWTYNATHRSAHYAIMVQHEDSGAEVRLFAHLDEYHLYSAEAMASKAHLTALDLAKKIEAVTPFEVPEIMKKDTQKHVKRKHWCPKCGPVDQYYPEWPPCKHEAEAA